MREKIDVSIIGKIADKSKKINTDTSIKSSTKCSTKIDTSTNVELKSYTKELQIKKIQRSYYIQSDLLKRFEMFCTNHDVDKSKVINDAIELFLDTYK